MGKLCFILAIHNHQPVGNFDRVIESAYQKAYLPFLKILQRYPEIKLVLHYSGNLLLWLRDNHRDFFNLLRHLVKQGNVELLSGGFYEPILPAIPDEDKIGQIKRLNEFIKEEFGYTPKGMWLTERVWEPALPRYIAGADIEYLPIDDYHFKLTGLRDRDLRGYFLTEDEDYVVKVFPGSERLRYLIPFKDVTEVISYLRNVSEDSELQTLNSKLICVADDGEKFGVWPETHKHVYKDGWLECFFSALIKNSDWLQTITFSEYLSKNLPAGKVYLPTASYRELGEWALLPQAQEEYEDAFNTLKKLFGSEKAQRLLRGGFWRNFLSKYPEGNHIHKRMFQISRKVHKAVKKLRVKSEKLKVKKKSPHASRLTPHDLLDELWQGQCNDAYWHGIFGGFYLPHLRSSLYTHLLEAEVFSEQILGLTPYMEEGDIDKDGYRDIFLSTKSLNLFLTERGGSLYELSHKRKAVNILDTISRRYEYYHKKLSTPVIPSETATIHERLAVKEEDIERYLIFDPYRKASLIDHFIAEDTTLNSFKEGRYEELGDFIEKPYNMRLKEEKYSFEVELAGEGQVSGVPVLLKKIVSVRKTKPQMFVSYAIRSLSNLKSQIFKDAVFCIEFNLSFFGSPSSTIEANKKRWAINSTVEERGLNSFNIKDEYLRLSVSFSFNRAVRLWQFPIETVSSSESGIEKVYQGSTFIIFPDPRPISGKENPFNFVVTLH